MKAKGGRLSKKEYDAFYAIRVEEFTRLFAQFPQDPPNEENEAWYEVARALPIETLADYFRKKGTTP